MGLGRKGLFAFTLLVLPLLILFAFLSIRVAEKQILKSETERVSLITEIVRNGLVTIMIEGHGKDLRKFLDTLVAEDIEGIYILGKEGKVISSTASPALDKPLLDQIRSRSWKENTFEMLPTKINERDIYSSILPIYNERTCQRCHGSREDIKAILHVEVSRSKTISKIKNLRNQIVFLTSLFFVISLYIFYRFNLTNLVKPINQLAETIKKHGKMEHQAGMDELQVLTFCVNDLIRNTEFLNKDMKVLESSNTDLLRRLDGLKMAIKEDIEMPLLKVIASSEAFLEEIEKNDPKKEILRAIINELKRISKTSLKLTQNSQK